MQILKFDVKDRYEITVITSSDTHSLWNRFKGRIIEDNETGKTASTYCDYESSSEGILSLLRYDKTNPNNRCLQISDVAKKGWKSLPPVLFETGGMYHFHIKFKDIKGDAKVIHPLKDLTDCFEYVGTGVNTGLITGVVNFGNQPGTFVLRFEYTDRKGHHHSESFSLDVVSTKLDTKHDLLEIKRLIEQEYENYVYQYLSLTYQNQSIHRKGRSEDDVWISIFQQIVDKYIKSVRYVMQHSHHRSCRKEYHQKPERIKHWDVHELEKWHNRGEDSDKYYYRNKVSEQTVNTRENRFIKYTLIKLEERISRVFSDIKKKYNDSLSEEYEKLMFSYCDTFRALLNSQFFRSVGTFEGRLQESQVLQQKAGYRNIYVYWQVLKSIVDLENGSTQIGMRQIWKLYEFWCYLVMKRLIAKTLEIEDTSNSPRIVMSGNSLAECLEDDKKTCKCRFYLNKEDESGCFDKKYWAELIYQCRYEYNDTATEEHSLTIEQIPDIVLNIHREGQETLTYLYDAKYRVYDDKIKNAEKATDEPVHDAINAMHRYRDAIYYGTTPDHRIPNRIINRPDSKEVIGGYILFPGRVGSDERLDDKYYIKSIESINIGAFPVMPSKFDPSKPNSENTFLMNTKLEEHLRKILTEPRVIAHIGNSVPQKGLYYTNIPANADDIVLVGCIRSKHQFDWVFDHGIYNIRLKIDDEQDVEGAVKPTRQFMNVSHILLYEEEDNSTDHYYDIEDPENSVPSYAGLKQLRATNYPFNVYPYPKNSYETRLLEKYGNRTYLLYKINRNPIIISDNKKIDLIRLINDHVTNETPIGTPFVISMSKLVTYLTESS